MVDTVEISKPFAATIVEQSSIPRRSYASLALTHTNTNVRWYAMLRSTCI